MGIAPPEVSSGLTRVYGSRKLVMVAVPLNRYVKYSVPKLDELRSRLHARSLEGQYPSIFHRTVIAIAKSRVFSMPNMYQERIRNRLIRSI